MQQERDTIDTKRIVQIGILIVAVTIVSSVIAYAILRVDLSGRTMSEPRTEVVHQEIAGVDQVEATSGWAVRLQTEQRKHLESYGWVDKEHGVAHVPIEKAMHDVATQRGEP